MKRKSTMKGKLTNKSKQRGAATLFTALILVVAATALVFAGIKITLNESRMSGDEYRTLQAHEAAVAALDQGLALFNSNGGNIDQTIVAPTASELDTLEANCTSLTPVTGAQEIGLPDLTSPQQIGLYYYANTTAGGDRCNANGDTDRGTLFAYGWSDDCSSRKLISSCLTVVSVFRNGDGPNQPFVTGASVGVFGNASVINRYTNISIWAGGDTDITGNSFATYLRPSGTRVSDFTLAELTDEDPGNNAQEVSNWKSGFGLDVVTDDVSLANLTRDDFFLLFFAQNKILTKRIAENGGTRVDPGSSPIPANVGTSQITSGYYWVGNATNPSTQRSSTASSINGGTYGSLTQPVVMIVNGDLSLSGNLEFFGAIYVTGELTITGTPTVKGSMISEQGPNSGNGTLNLVYVPMGGEGNGMPPPVVADGGVLIPGSWRDW